MLFTGKGEVLTRYARREIVRRTRRACEVRTLVNLDYIHTMKWLRGAILTRGDIVETREGEGERGEGRELFIFIPIRAVV